MAHLFRFMGEPQTGGGWALTADEAYHASKVLRLSPGAEVEVCDGQGRWGRGILTELTAKAAHVEADTLVVAAPRVLVELGLGALKPGVVDEILPMLTELGVDRIHLFHQHETAKNRLNPKAHERWQRIVVQAMKQCKRAWLPQLCEHASVGAMIAALKAAAPAGAGPAEAVRFVLREARDPSLTSLLAQHGTTPCSRLAVVVGGEKGYDASELAALMQAGFQPASLGPYVLRAITAAVAGVASLSLHRQNLC